MTNTKIPKLSSLIKDWKFDWVNIEITDNIFPKPKEIGTEYELVQVNRHISSEDAIKELEKNGWRAANAWELLQWKDWNKKDWVVALGSVGKVRGFRRVLYLYEGGRERGLSLGWWVDGWSSRCRFLRVRNSSLKTSETLKNDTVTLGNLELAIKLVKENGYVIYKQV